MKTFLVVHTATRGLANLVSVIIVFGILNVLLVNASTTLTHSEHFMLFMLTQSMSMIAAFAVLNSIKWIHQWVNSRTSPWNL